MNDFCIVGLENDTETNVICDQDQITEAISTNYIVKPNPAVAIGELYRTYVGMVVISANLLLILFLTSRPNLRKKYFLFTCVAIGDTFDGSYFLFPSLNRLYKMTTGTYYQTTTFWDCVQRGNMAFRIFGTEFVGVNMFLLSLERVLAVGFPFFYRARFNTKFRLLLAFIGLIFCLINQGAMYLTSYLYDGNETQSDYYCGISGSVTDGFALYHQNLNIVTQVASFLLSLFAYGYAMYSKKKMGLDTSKDIAAIRPVLVSSCIACILIIANNIVYILKNFTNSGVTVGTQNIVVTWSPAVFQVYKFALYLMTSKEMRMSLKRLVLDESGIHGPRMVSQTPIITPNKPTLSAITVASAANAFTKKLPSPS
ncbi:unnamed protein product, partial [Mesorhabditis belari]|uniref:G-protein coupled receptors family 1 profile domain-containing protein n=1 Tax=Mesorhabditis belari TaxID=2138241 RepID=A0AAF3F3M2_9BILA